MTCKRVVKAFVAFCATAILVIAVGGCDDLGAYESTQEYYDSFGDVVLISGASGEKKSYSVEESFYNKESRDNFMSGEDSAYQRVAHSDYVYVAIPFKNTIEMDSFALFLQSQADVTVHIDVFAVDGALWDVIAEADRVLEESKEEILYDDLGSDARIGEATVHLETGKWGSFVVDIFRETQKSIQIQSGQYVVLQIRNNSGVRVFDEDKQMYVDPQTGLELKKAEITMTNLLIRSLETRSDDAA